VSSFILNVEISGTAINTFFIPPKHLNLASTSPNERETERLPGYIRWGPSKI
jgi:hypothetical protein